MIACGGVPSTMKNQVLPLSRDYVYVCTSISRMDNSSVTEMLYGWPMMHGANK